MPTTINASNTSGGAVVTGDGSGVLELQSGGVTGITVNGANVTVAGTLTATGGVSGGLVSPATVAGNSSAGAEIRLPEDTDNGTNYVALKAANALAANLTLTLPAADGTNGQFLQTNGSGALGFATVASVTPGGSTGQLQYNNAGAFGGVSSGTTGQVLTSAGAGSVPTWSNTGVQQFTASGSITAGQPVCLRSDGAVEVATGFQQAEALGAAQVRAGADSTGQKIIVPIPNTSNLLIIVNNGSTQQALVASVSGETITYNTATTVPWGAVDNGIACTFDPVSGKALITFMENASTGTLRGVVCTITGTTVAFGSAQVIASLGSSDSRQASCYDPLRQQIIIGTVYSSPQTFAIWRATISGTTFTASGQFTAITGTGVNSGINLLYDTAVDRIVAVSQSSSVNNVQLVSNSGTAFALAGSSAALGITPVENGVTFDSVNNKYVAVAANGSNNPVARTFSITASSITVDAAPTFPVLPESRTISGGTSFSGPKASYDVVAQKVVYLFYTNANNIRYITSSGFGASMAFSSYNETALLTRLPRIAYLPAQNRTIFYIINDSNGANLRIFLPAADTSNTQNFIGLAAASATTGQSLNVTVTGGTNANQTGLVTGTSYFLTSLGALTTAGGVRVGEALSATSMFVEGRLNSSGTPSSSTFLRGDGAFAALPAATSTLIASGTLTSAAANILVNNLNVTAYNSIILEVKLTPESGGQNLLLSFVAPAGTSANGQLYVGYSFVLSNSGAVSGTTTNGGSKVALTSASASSSSELYAIVNVQQTNQTTTKRGFNLSSFGDTAASIGHIRVGGGYSNASSWGGFLIEPSSGNLVAGSSYRIYGVI